MSSFVLLVEDSLDDELLSLKAIKKSGVPCETIVARHGAEAMDLILSAHGPRPDLIVLDFHLPGYSGLELLRELRKQERTRFIPVVILSSLESDQEVKNCFTEGANSCVRKPVEPQVYVEHVALILKYWLTVNRGEE